MIKTLQEYNSALAELTALETELRQLPYGKPTRFGGGVTSSFFENRIKDLQFEMDGFLEETKAPVAEAAPILPQVVITTVTELLPKAPSEPVVTTLDPVLETKEEPLPTPINLADYVTEVKEKAAKLPKDILAFGSKDDSKK